MMYQTIYGEIETPDWENDLIVNSLRSRGEWSYLEQCLFAPMLRRDDALWDGGAFLGTFGLGSVQIAAQLGQAPSYLLAIEPGAELIPHLESNLRRNASCEFNLASVGIGPASGTLVVKDITGENHGALAYEPATTPSSKAGVSSQALWQLRERYGFYDALKLDIEGMEAAALHDEFEYIQHHRPLIWCECNEALSSIKLLEVLEAAGYEPLYVAFPAFRLKTFNGEISPPFPVAYEAVLLGCPASRIEDFDSHASGEEVVVKVVHTSWDLRQALWLTPRWALEEWACLSRPELIALLTRQHQKSDLGRFLNDRA